MATTQTDYRTTLRDLSDRIVEAQRPIRILDSIKWDQGVQEAFFAGKCKSQPAVDREYYTTRPVGFDPDAKLQEFSAIEREVIRRLGQFSPVGQIMTRMCREYEMVVRMLEARGTPEFADLSAELYGSASDVFHAGDPTLADLGVMMSDALVNIDRSTILEEDRRTIPAEEAVRILQERLDKALPRPNGGVKVVLNDGIVADAAAGSDYIKIRTDSTFSERDLQLLEIHEGWVHVGTTLNGLAQPVCTFLSKGPPSSTITQEGLAVFMEAVTFCSHPERLRRITNRIQGIEMAEQGATFLDVFRFHRDQGFDNEASFTNTMRIFRGSTPTGRPFTKDLSYAKGFVLVYNYTRLAVLKGLLDRIPLLWCGKTRLEDMRLIAQLVDEGVVAQPEFLPPQIKDMKALIAWMCYSSFMNRLTLERIEQDYANIL